MRGISIAFALPLCLASISATPQETSYQVGDWLVNKKISGVQIANVSTESGQATAGILCFVSTNSCIAYLHTGNKCEIGATIPMMINSPVGAFHITTECKDMPGTPSGFINVVNEFGNAKEAFESGGEVGFVIPLKSGEFRALRFSTKGAVAAIRNAMTSPTDSTPVKRRDDRRL